MVDAREKAREATRTALSEAAWEIVRQDGPAALTMRRLADGVGYTPGALYRHVENRNELMLLLAYDALGLLAEAMRDASPLSPVHKVHDYLQRSPDVRAVLFEGIVLDSGESAAPDTRRLLLGRLIRILRSLANGQSEQGTMTGLAVLIGALAIDNTPILKSLGFTGHNILSHYADITGLD